MRRLEGSALARDMTERLDALSALLGELAGLAAAAPEEARRRLSERLGKLLESDAVDPARLAQEVAVLADKLDISEEIVRARSHVEQLRGLVQGSGGKAKAVGRRLDFLVQELGRELNTMGAKSSSIELVRRVVAGKAELEKVREQVQNVE
jgi:uncharacterized protein (TIGR00255 family)